MIVYSRPPYPSHMTNADTAYPYLLINTYDETTLRYVNKDSARFIKSVIIDSGVQMCTKRTEKEMVWRMFLERVAQVSIIKRL